MKDFETITGGTLMQARHPDYAREVAAAVEGGLAPGLLREKLGGYHENDIAAAMALLTKDQRCRLYSVLDLQTLADVMMHVEQPNEYLAELGIRRQAELLERMDVPVAVEYLSQMEKSQRDLLLELLEEDTREQIALSGSFGEEEVGSWMTANYISINAALSVRQAMKELIRQAAEHDNISTLYVTEADGTLRGAIDLKDLILARETTALDTIIMTTYPYVYVNERIEDCIERVKGYSEDSIPVLDAQNRLKGVLTAQTIVELVDDTLGDDYAKLGGLAAEEDLREPTSLSVRKRLPWLVVLLGMGLVVSSVVGLFERVVAHLTMIICFQSLVLDMAGNVGTQSLAVTIRVLMDENVSGKEKRHLILKEGRGGLLNGACLGVLSFVCIGLYLLLLKGQSPVTAFSVSACTGIALLVAMLLSSVAGTVIPILFKKMKVDPAVASGPLITTVNDLVAVVTYYGLAWLLLINILGL